jgi:hypothetical protein
MTQAEFRLVRAALQALKELTRPNHSVEYAICQLEYALRVEDDGEGSPSGDDD